MVLVWDFSTSLFHFSTSFHTGLKKSKSICTEIITRSLFLCSCCKQCIGCWCDSCCGNALHQNMGMEPSEIISSNTTSMCLWNLTYVFTYIWPQCVYITSMWKICISFVVFFFFSFVLMLFSPWKLPGPLHRFWKLYILQQPGTCCPYLPHLHSNCKKKHVYYVLHGLPW